MRSQLAELQTLFDDVNHQSHRECKRIEELQEPVNAGAKQSERLIWFRMRQTGC